MKKAIFAVIASMFVFTSVFAADEAVKLNAEQQAAFDKCGADQVCKDKVEAEAKAAAAAAATEKAAK